MWTHVLGDICEQKQVWAYGMCPIVLSRNQGSTQKGNDEQVWAKISILVTFLLIRVLGTPSSPNFIQNYFLGAPLNSRALWISAINQRSTRIVKLWQEHWKQTRSGTCPRLPVNWGEEGIWPLNPGHFLKNILASLALGARCLWTCKTLRNFFVWNMISGGSVNSLSLWCIPLAYLGIHHVFCVCPCWFLLRPLSLVYRQLSFPVSPHSPSPVCVCVPFSSSYKDTSHVGLRPTLMISFNLITFLETLSPNSITFWGIRDYGSTYEYWGDTIQPITLKCYNYLLMPLSLSLAMNCWRRACLLSILTYLVHDHLHEDWIMEGGTTSPRSPQGIEGRGRLGPVARSSRESGAPSPLC